MHTHTANLLCFTSGAYAMCEQKAFPKRKKRKKKKFEPFGEF
jgi:hypothetical protein